MPLMTIVLLALPALAQEPQQETPVFRASVTLVRVDAQVLDRSGRAVSDLTPADFQVFDENQPQEIVHFGRESEPLDLVLLLDVSGSMTRYLEEMAASARAALEPLAGEDRVGIMLYARNSAVRKELTNDRADLQNCIREAVRDKTLGSGTAMNSAIIAAAQYAARQPVRGRRAILIVTDNNDLNYQVPDEDAIRALYAADAVLNVILVGKQKRPEPLKSGAVANPDFTPDDALKLAEATGGEIIEARKGGASFQQMIEHIRARYAIQYEAPAGAAPGTFRGVRLELSAGALERYPKAVVRARAGYYTAP